MNSNAIKFSSKFIWIFQDVEESIINEPKVGNNEDMIIPNLLNPALLAGAGPRGLALPNLMGTPNPLSNPALVNQIQQIQRLHAQNSRLIGK